MHGIGFMIGISRPSLSKIVKTEEAGSSFSTPKRRYEKTRARVVTDSFDVEAIRRKIYEQYDKNKRVTLNSLLVRISIENNEIF